MRSARRWRAVVGALVFFTATRAVSGTIALVPEPDGERHEQLVRGARLAMTTIGGDHRLVVGQEVELWKGLTSVIEDLIEDEGAEVLLAPVDLRAAHLVAQIVSRRHLPAIATWPAKSIAATGSWWIVACGWPPSEEGELAKRLGRRPSPWELAGWSATRVAAQVLERLPPPGGPPTSSWRDDLPGSCQGQESADRGRLDRRVARATVTSEPEDSLP